MKTQIGSYLAVIAIAGVLGFFVGQRTQRGAADGGLSAGSSTSSGGASSVRPGRSGADGSQAGLRQEARYSASPAVRIRAVLEEMSRSPMVMMDMDTMFNAYEALRELSPAEVQAALLELEQADGSQQVKMMLQMMLINRWAKEDGQGAVQYALEQEQPQLKMMGMMGGLMGWIRSDPDGAYTWYEENRDTAGKGMMMGPGGLDGMMFNALAQRDMQGAFAKLSGLDARAQKSALNSMAGSVGLDPVKRAEFLEGLEGIENEKARAEAITHMVSTMAWQAPADAVAFMESREWPEDERTRLEASIAQSWSNTDPEEAIKWQMRDLEEGAKIPDNVSNTFGTWVRNDPDSAEQWLNSQPEATHPDSLYRSAADQLRFAEDFQRSLDFALRMENADQRTQKAREIYQAWGTRDPDAADAWIGQMDGETQEALKAGNEALAEPFESPPGE